jgi:hypothetical protein
MRRVVKARLNRWAELVLLTVIGSFALALFGSRIFVVVDDFILKVAAKEDYDSALNYLSIAIFITIGFLHYFLRTRISHLEHILKYPPLPCVVMFSFLVAPLWPLPFESAGGIIKGDWGLAIFCSITSAVVWLLYAKCFSFFDQYFSSGNDREVEAQDSPELDENPLVRWLHQHDAIHDRKLDLFDHTIVSDRLAKRLQEKAQSMALLGLYGAGKSSVCQMLEQKSEDIFVTVSCWGFSSSEKIQGILLERILEELAKHVDCFNIRTLPDHYIKAIGGYSSCLDSLLKLVSHNKTPPSEIERLSPILSAINKRIVVVIEDLDRNQEGFKLSQIQALLMQLKHVKEVSFILAISPSQDVDFLKVCEYLELIDDLPRHRIMEIVDQLRSVFLEGSCGIILTEPMPSLLTDEAHLLQGDRSLSYHYPRERSLFCLLNTPRKLRTTMLRVFTVWQDIQGEVRIDDLISMCTLRIAAPEAFRYFQKNWSKIGAVANERNAKKFVKDGNQKICDQLLEEWGHAVLGVDFDHQAAAELICKLCPEFSTVVRRKSSHQQPSQSMAKACRRSVYAKRLFSESVAGETIKDQFILQCLQQSRTDRKYLTKLAEEITDSDSAADVFKDFSVVKNFRLHLDLLSQVCKVIKQRHGPICHHRSNYGLLAVWRMIESGNQDGVNEWVRLEIKACIPRYLNLMELLYAAWFGTFPQNSDARKGIRLMMLSGLKKAWEDADTTEVAKSFDPLQPYTLFNLIYTPDFQNSDAVHYGKIEDWAWLGPIIWLGCQKQPHVFIPQVVVLLARNDAGGGSRELQYEFNMDAVNQFLGENARNFFETLATVFEIPEGFSEQNQYRLGLAKDRALELFDSFTDEPPEEADTAQV